MKIISKKNIYWFLYIFAIIIVIIIYLFYKQIYIYIYFNINYNEIEWLKECLVNSKLTEYDIPYFSPKYITVSESEYNKVILDNNNFKDKHFNDIDINVSEICPNQIQIFQDISFDYPNLLWLEFISLKNQKNEFYESIKINFRFAPLFYNDKFYFEYIQENTKSKEDVKVYLKNKWYSVYDYGWNWIMYFYKEPKK